MKPVTLDDLLVGPTKVEIPVHGKTVKNKDGVIDTAKITFYVRPARQSERDLAAAAARKASRTLRKKMETEGTEERENLVLAEVEDASINYLRGLWVNDKVIDRAARIRRESLEERPYIPEPEGDHITQKDMDDYENDVEDAEDGREMDVLQAIIAAREELEKEAAKLDSEKMRELAIPSQIEAQANRAYETEFALQLIYRCTFTDKKCTKQAFSDIEQVYQLKDAPLTMLTNAHMSLLIDPERIKNLAGGLRR